MGSFRWIGILCIIGGLGTFGCLQANRKRRRLWWLRQLEWNLHTLEQKILQLHMPLALALNSQQVQPADEVGQCLVQWGNVLYRNRELNTFEAWQCVFQKQTQWDYLAEEDCQLMRKLALQIGKGSEEEEKRLFQFILAETKNQQEKAKEKIQSECRLWSCGGFMAGMMLVLLFL